MTAGRIGVGLVGFRPGLSRRLEVALAVLPEAVRRLCVCRAGSSVLLFTLQSV